MSIWNMKRSSCASGSGYVPSCSIGFCVAKTKNGGSQRVRACPDGDALLLHRLQQRGLRLRRRAVDLVGEHDVREDRARQNTNAAAPVAGSSWMMSVPVMSDGIRSGVNWMRENVRSSACASV